MNRNAPAQTHDDSPVQSRLAQTGVLTLTLNRPESRNALGQTLMTALQAAFDAAAREPAVRVIVLAAHGPAFCAGHDLKELTAHLNDDDKGEAYFRALFAQCAHLMKTIVRLPKPVIAAVQGVATAAGCQLVASCDLAVSSCDAHYATPGVNIGLFCSTPMVALSRNVAPKHAMEMLLTGDMVSAEDAARIGLVNHVVQHESLMTAAYRLAEKIASKSHASIAIGKEAFYAQAERGLDDAYAYASEVMTRNMLMADANEGICAFIEKRQPRWSE